MAQRRKEKPCRTQAYHRDHRGQSGQRRIPGRQELAADGTVLLGSRDIEKGEAATRKIGGRAIAIQIDVTD
ncbi:hypothetical protein GOL45_23430 [Sinorhizobium medicae]|nr:hypothetical protein [Sinorhizobium medicae]MDX0528750.1 hypothetical protein [Sinorhizobium medicae]MDX0559346.1 hypothetical protein [Sinorhizobium medicae]MDX0921228.1 hypothetical protein [Sinorhizobium medicae]MDX0935099.1 hypothetical protein [Sinorhizobium medicae]